MKNTSLLCAMVAAAAFAGHAEAIYKCTTPKGVVYQDRPCREGSETDVRIVIPTGEVAPKSVAAEADDGQASGTRPRAHFGARRSSAAAPDDPGSATRSGDPRADAAAASASDGGRRSDTRSTAGNSGNSMTAEQAGRLEPTAKYLTTDAATPGFETPQHMTCESANGEKRVFTLTNGKLTSI